MGVMIVGKPVTTRQNSACIGELTQKRNLLNAVNVGKPSQGSLSSGSVRKLTGEKPNECGKTFCMETSLSIGKYTQGNNLTNVMHGKPSLGRGA